MSCIYSSRRRRTKGSKERNVERNCLLMFAYAPHNATLMQLEANTPRLLSIVAVPDRLSASIVCNLPFSAFLFTWVDGAECMFPLGRLTRCGCLRFLWTRCGRPPEGFLPVTLLRGEERECTYSRPFLYIGHCMSPVLEVRWPR